MVVHQTMFTVEAATRLFLLPLHSRRWRDLAVITA